MRFSTEHDINEYNEREYVYVEQLSPEEQFYDRRNLGDDHEDLSIRDLATRSRRWVVRASNEGGYNSTVVDLIQLLYYVKNNLPDLWNSVQDDTADIWKKIGKDFVKDYPNRS